MNTNFAVIRVVGYEVEYLGRDGSWGSLGGAHQYSTRAAAAECAGQVRGKVLALWAVSR